MNDPMTPSELVKVLHDRAPQFEHEPRFDTWQMWTIDLLNAAADMIEALTDSKPLPVVIHCPQCGIQHIDVDDDSGAWATTRLHRKHLCKPEDGGCGFVWMPADIYTVGVAAIVE